MVCSGLQGQKFALTAAACGHLQTLEHVQCVVAPALQALHCVRSGKHVCIRPLHLSMNVQCEQLLLCISSHGLLQCSQGCIEIGCAWVRRCAHIYAARPGCRADLHGCCGTGSHEYITAATLCA